MEHRLLRSFLVLAEELHFGRAAKRLHLSQPPLSLQIRKLEEDLGTRLFERDSRHVSLTEAGTELIGRARHILAESERARAEVRRVGLGEGGVLSIGYTPTATHEVLPRLIPEFRRRHPHVLLELAEMTSREQVTALAERRIELGFACLPVEAPGLVARTLVAERPVVLLPDGHRLAGKGAVPVRELAGEPFVLVDPEVEPGWAHAAARAIRDAGVELSVVQRTDTKIALLGLVAAGMGLSVASESLGVLGRRGVAVRPLTGVKLAFRLGVMAPPTPSPRAALLLGEWPTRARARTQRPHGARAQRPPKPS